MSLGSVWSLRFSLCSQMHSFCLSTVNREPLVAIPLIVRKRMGVSKPWCRLPAMRLSIREMHAATSATSLNDEWFVLENTGDRSFSTAGCTVLVGRGKGRLRSVGALDPGFTLAPGDRVRVVTGNPGKKAHGTPPDGDPKSYHLFLAERLLAGPGTVLALAMKQHEVARATFDPEVEGGVAKTEDA